MKEPPVIGHLPDGHSNVLSPAARLRLDQLVRSFIEEVNEERSGASRQFDVQPANNIRPVALRPPLDESAHKRGFASVSLPDLGYLRDLESLG